jgi:hypothetical protein
MAAGIKARNTKKTTLGSRNRRAMDDCLTLVSRGEAMADQAKSDRGEPRLLGLAFSL